MRTPSQMTRYYLLNELRHNRACMRVGSTSAANGRKDRHFLQRELVKLRKARKSTVPL